MRGSEKGKRCVGARGLCVSAKKVEGEKKRKRRSHVGLPGKEKERCPL